MAAAAATELGLAVHVSRGVGAANAAALAAIPGVSGICGGHAVVARAVSVGMERAAAEFAAAVRTAHRATRSPGPSQPNEDFR